MDTCLPRLFYPTTEGGNLAPTQDRSKTKNQLAHDSKARALPLGSVNDLRLPAGNSAGTLANSAAATCGHSCLDPVKVVASSCGASGNAEVALRGSAFCWRPGERDFASPRQQPTLPTLHISPTTVP